MASKAAVALASMGSEPLVLVHVINDTSLGDLGQSVYDQILEEGRNLLKAEVAALAKPGVRIEAKLMTGGLVDRVSDLVASDPAAHLVVVGAPGKKVWPFGSRTVGLGERLPCATLSVREAEPFVAWASGEKPLPILVGFDFTRAAERAIEWVAALAHFGRVDLRVANIDWPPAEHKRLGLADNQALFTNDPATEQFLERDLHRRVEALVPGLPFQVVVRASWGRPDADLSSLAKESGTGLLVVGTHQANGLRRLWRSSTSRHLLRDSPVSVACVPVAAVAAHHHPPAATHRMVLVATDFSDIANTAVAHAFATCSEGGTVCLFHVVPSGGSTASPGLGKDSEGAHGTNPKLEIAHAVNRLKALIPDTTPSAHVHSLVEVVEHKEPAQAICQAAERLDADLLVVGSRGGSKLRSAVLGSVANSVLDQTRRPILIVKPPLA